MSVILSALRKGVSLPNKTGWKWAGIATVAALIALKTAQSFGYLAGMSDESAIEIVGLLVTLYLSVATTDCVGLPARELPSEPVQADRTNTDRSPFLD